MTQTVIVVYPAGTYWNNSGLPVLAQEQKRMELKIPTNGEGTTDKLDTVWRMMNHVDGSEIEEQLMGFKVRSMMVGDLVMVDGFVYRCASIGWERVK